MFASVEVAELDEAVELEAVDELELLAKLMTDKEIKQLAKDHGMDDDVIAKKLK